MFHKIYYSIFSLIWVTVFQFFLSFLGSCLHFLGLLCIWVGMDTRVRNILRVDKPWFVSLQIGWRKVKIGRTRREGRRERIGWVFGDMKWSQTKDWMGCRKKWKMSNKWRYWRIRMEKGVGWMRNRLGVVKRMRKGARFGWVGEGWTGRINSFFSFRFGWEGEGWTGRGRVSSIF